MSGARRQAEPDADGVGRDLPDPARAARRARRERLKEAHPDTGGSAEAFQEAVRARPRPLLVVFRPRLPGVPDIVQDLARDVQAARFRRRRSRVD